MHLEVWRTVRTTFSACSCNSLPPSMKKVGMVTAQMSNTMLSVSGSLAANSFKTSR